MQSKTDKVIKWMVCNYGFIGMVTAAISACAVFYFKFDAMDKAITNPDTGIVAMNKSITELKNANTEIKTDLKWLINTQRSHILSSESFQLRDVATNP